MVFVQNLSCTRACPTIDLNIVRCHASRCVRSQQRTKMVYEKCVGYFGCSMQTSQAIFAIDVIRATRCLTMTWDVRLPIVITMNVFFAAPIGTLLFWIPNRCCINPCQTSKTISDFVSCLILFLPCARSSWSVKNYLPVQGALAVKKHHSISFIC